ncbi:VOC family protein [Nigerium massiliense]|uniref:VOC family protein n=1 Tax=Nigerium massiliense TaxID=1522317 RepID=UPI00058E54CD|nr:VOC family protein [Nigerium massiliense]
MKYLQDGDELIKADRWGSIVPELAVTDLDASVAFYTQMLGFQSETVRPGLVVLSHEDTPIQFVLEQLDPNDPPSSAELAAPFGRGLTLSVRVAEPQKIYETLRAQHHPILVPMQVAEYDEGDQAYTRSEFAIQDPDGYVLRFTD